MRTSGNAVTLSVSECESKAQIEEKRATFVHLIADFVSPKVIEDADEIREILIEAARRANNTPLEITIHKFPVQGITGVILLAESHIAIHTWPEYDYVAVDIFTCGKTTNPYKALEYLKEKFCPQKVKFREIKRGRP
jgi:S-adenosylmethionine decarboxylase